MTRMAKTSWRGRASGVVPLAYPCVVFKHGLRAFRLKLLFMLVSPCLPFRVVHDSALGTTSNPDTSWCKSLR